MKLGKEPTGPKITFSYRCQEPLRCLAVRICAEGPPSEPREDVQIPTKSHRPAQASLITALKDRHPVTLAEAPDLVYSYQALQCVLGAGLALAQMPHARGRIHVPCFGKWILNHWANRKVEVGAFER